MKTESSSAFIKRVKNSLMRINAVILFLSFILVIPVSADPAVNYTSGIDWKKGELEIAVEVNYPPESGKLRMRDNSETLFDEKFFDIFIDSISKTHDGTVFFNSHYTMNEIIQHHPVILNKIETIKNSAVMVYNVYHEDMSGVKMLYRIDMFENIVPYFIFHKKPHPVQERYIWTPNEKYTGVVIYAKGEYPVRGESEKDTLKPSLFPSVYSKDMDKIIAEELVKPDVLVKWGTAALTDSEDDPLIRERTGENPLYTMAEEIFGRNKTDLIVPSNAADLLLYKNLNIDLIREGRFVIITDLP